jgi:rSAM/selenodomain-associated transferase 1
MGELLLQQFAKAPVAGSVKTRMIPSLDAREACTLHEQLLTWTGTQLLAAQLAPVELWVSGSGNYPVFNRLLAQGVSGLREQSGPDLGARMYHALADGLARHEQVILVGSDCPAIDAAYLALAVTALASNDLVLGPADDGGYVMIACRRVVPEVFADIRWGTDSVLAETVVRVRAAGLDYELLPSLCDIDRPEDLAYWYELSSSQHISS